MARSHLREREFRTHAEHGYRSNPGASWHAKRVAALEARLAKASHKDQKLLILGGLSEQRASVRASKHIRVANPKSSYPTKYFVCRNIGGKVQICPARIQMDYNRLYQKYDEVYGPFNTQREAGREADSLLMNPPKKLGSYTRVNPEREWHSEWGATYNMISKRAQNELDRMYFEGKRDANLDASREEDRRFYSGRERRHPNPRKRKRTRRNCNPRKGGVEIYSNILAIEARKGKGSLWPNEKFRHGFKSKSEATVYGLPDGSLHIKSKAGKRLWKKFKYKKGVDY